jgi:hypothetical protein
MENLKEAISPKYLFLHNAIRKLTSLILRPHSVGSSRQNLGDCFAGRKDARKDIYETPLE